MDIVLATANAHKAQEFGRIFPEHRIRTPRDLGIEFLHDETGETFFQNALGKAVALRALVDLPVLADDSGLCVEALGGEPGIRSARYGASGGARLDDGDRNRYLLGLLEGAVDRDARFVCCLVLMLTADRWFAFQETLEGSITRSPAGAGGFGYDPVFYVPQAGKTVAELPDAVKDRISHRGKAGARARAVLAQLQAGG